MPEIILHHYPTSTFSEKARLAFGLKRLSYEAVITPPALPKPDLVALTGGYRRAPVMQIGADVYCDTELILRKLEELHPEPTLFPGRCQGQATAIAKWAERYIFTPTLGFIANVNGDLFTPEFVAERKRFGFILGKDDVVPLFNRYVQQLAANLEWVVEMLADGRPYALGERVSAADLGLYPSIWLLRRHGRADAERMLPMKPLMDWAERVAGLGHGNASEISGAEALDIARHAKLVAPDLVYGGDPSELKEGAAVTVTPDDTGRDPISGVLVAASNREVVILRSLPGGGEVQLHFPRAGYDLEAA